MLDLNTLLSKGPVPLIQQLTSAYINGSDADIHAQIVLHMNNAISWSGVPMQLLESDNRLFVVLELVSTSPSQQKSNLLLDLTYKKIYL